MIVRGFKAAIILLLLLAGNPLLSTAKPAPQVTNVTENARLIYLRGLELGNRRDVFSKIGDSITVSGYFLYPIGQGLYNLRDYGYLQPTIDFFSTRRARTGNSFMNQSLSADNGWTTNDVLNVNRRNRRVCRRNETPLECEYRTVKPSVALIMLGTNDVQLLSHDEYRANITRIVEISIAKGVIPVLTIIPWRFGYDDKCREFGGILWEIAAQYSIPVWDYNAGIFNLNNHGISEDGAHPSLPSLDPAASVDFTGDNLQYGYTVRNLQALQVLDTLRTTVLY